MVRSFKALSFTLALILGWLVVPAIVSAQDLGIVTGSSRGTYIKIGQDISQLVAPHGISLDVRESNGSIENILAVRHTAGVQLGIVQSDVLEYIQGIAETDQDNSAEMLDLVKRIKMVFPLYNEEIHILAQPGIAQLSDLNGKRVAIGKENSGTFLTSVVLFKLTGVEPAESYPKGSDEALEALRRNEIDAMIYVAGQPTKLFAEDVTAQDGFVFVPITDPNVVGGFYKGARLEQRNYSWLTADVNTAAVKAVLVAYNYRGENCGHIGKLARLVYDGQDALKKNGHSKWNAVNLDQTLEKWERYDCVTKALPAASAETSEENLDDLLRD